MYEIVPIYFLGIILTGIYSYLTLQSKKIIHGDFNGNTTLKMNPFYKHFGNFGLSISLIYACSIFFITNKVYLVIGGLMVFLYGFLGIYMRILFRNHSIIFNELEAEIYNWRGKKKVIQIQDIVNVKKNHFTGYYT